MKKKEMSKLKVGDFVCDCKFEHLLVVKVDEVRMPWKPWFYRKVVYSDFTPDWLMSAIETVWSYLCELLHITVLVDKDLVLEDGAHCSAIHCCDPVDHQFEHPTKA